MSLFISVFMVDTEEINDYVDMSPFGRVAYMAVFLQLLAHSSIKVYNMCLWKKTNTRDIRRGIVGVGFGLNYM